MSYKCEQCHTLVEQGVPQLKRVVEKRVTDKGWEIAKEMRICFDCNERSEKDD